ncbi:MAG TPA: PIN domain-containing protein [Stellaceae bacterium]
MFDTDICSYIVRRSHPIILDRLSTMATDDVCISVIVKSELLFGIDMSTRPRREFGAVQDLLAQIAVLDFPDAAAAHYAQIRADLTKRGALIGANDLLIAAHARCLGMILVTNNVREFSRVRRLSIENWTEL